MIQNLEINVVNMKIVLSFEEFLITILTILVLIVFIYVLLYEYSVWRRKRLYRLVGKGHVG